MKIFKKVLAGIFAIILISMAGLVGICQTEKYEGLVITSGSMVPTLEVKDFILTEKAQEYNKGDVISFNVEGQDITTHRIVEVTEEGYVTKGDANNSEDTEVVKEADVIGKMLCTIPLLGTIYMLITSISFDVYLGIGLIALGTIVFLVVYEYLCKKE
ncbi:MAG: signal peptidase I [Clostridia bacterium]